MLFTATLTVPLGLRITVADGKIVVASVKPTGGARTWNGSNTPLIHKGDEILSLEHSNGKEIVARASDVTSIAKAHESETLVIEFRRNPHRKGKDAGHTSYFASLTVPLGLTLNSDHVVMGIDTQHSVGKWNLSAKKKGRNEIRVKDQVVAFYQDEERAAMGSENSLENLPEGTQVELELVPHTTHFESFLSAAARISIAAYRQAKDSTAQLLNISYAHEFTPAPAWLLGQCYEYDEHNDDKIRIKAFVEDFKRRFWFTYRSGFPRLENGNANITSDTGWGCMLRSAQMIMGQAFFCHYLGRDWKPSTEAASFPIEYFQILRWFLDFPGPSYPYSIHNMLEHAKVLGKPVDSWHGPWAVCVMLQKCFEAQSPPDLSLVVCDDGTLYKDFLFRLCGEGKEDFLSGNSSSSSSSSSGSSGSSSSNSSSSSSSSSSSCNMSSGDDSELRLHINPTPSEDSGSSSGSGSGGNSDGSSANTSSRHVPPLTPSSVDYTAFPTYSLSPSAVPSDSTTTTATLTPSITPATTTDSATPTPDLTPIHAIRLPSNNLSALDISTSTTSTNTGASHSPSLVLHCSLLSADFTSESQQGESKSEFESTSTVPTTLTPQSRTPSFPASSLPSPTATNVSLDDSSVFSRATTIDAVDSTAANSVVALPGGGNVFTNSDLLDASNEDRLLQAPTNPLSGLSETPVLITDIPSAAGVAASSSSSIDPANVLPATPIEPPYAPPLPPTAEINAATVAAAASDSTASSSTSTTVDSPVPTIIVPTTIAVTTTATATPTVNTPVAPVATTPTTSSSSSPSSASFSASSPSARSFPRPLRTAFPQSPRTPRTPHTNDTPHSPQGSANWRALIILVPLRLGMKNLNPFYVDSLLRLFQMPQTLGIIGGKPSSSLYFVGTQGTRLFYLDPHTTQPVVGGKDEEGEKSDDSNSSSNNNDGMPFNNESFHCATPQSINIGNLDPSMALAFYCRTRADLEDLFQRVQLMGTEATNGSLPVIATADIMPAYLYKDAKRKMAQKQAEPTERESECASSRCDEWDVSSDEKVMDSASEGDDFVLIDD